MNLDSTFQFVFDLCCFIVVLYTIGLNSVKPIREMYIFEDLDNDNNVTTPLNPLPYILYLVHFFVCILLYQLWQAFTVYYVKVRKSL